MPIYTTYLANKPKLQAQNVIGSCFVYFVMRDRGNNEVAPSEDLLRDAKKGRINWETYEKIYRDGLHTPKAVFWMQARARDAGIGNILLVCFEKDAAHCHRRLLAEEIARRFSVEYKGELPEYSWPCHYFRAKVVNDICQSPKKDPICLQCRFRP